MADDERNESEETQEEAVEEIAAEAEEQPVAEVEAEAETEGEPAAEEESAAEEEPTAEAPPQEATRRKKRKRLPRSRRPQRTKPKRETSAARGPITRLPKPERERGRRQERQGTVVSAAADKTIVVRVEVVKLHPLYKKVIRRSTKLHAHDELNEAKVGDVVRIVETRPLSQMKRWRLQEIVEAAK